MKKRTKVDFSKHILKVTQFDGVLIHEFKNPDTRICMLTFINTHDTMTVTGDFGNWVFCREFHPSKDGSVNDTYWDGKLELYSIQKSHKYDAAETLKSIIVFKNSFEDYFDRKMNASENNWIAMLENIVDDEVEYKYLAYRGKPTYIDYEYVPIGEKRHFFLDAVYDGFDEICKVLKQEDTNNIKKT